MSEKTMEEVDAILARWNFEAAETTGTEKPKTKKTADAEELQTLLSDATLTDEFVASLQGKARFVSEWQAWAIYDDARGIWSHADRRLVKRQVKTWLQKKHETMADDYKASQLKPLLSGSKIDEVQKQAEADTLTMARQFDIHRDLLLVGNGALNLRTGELREATPEDMFTKGTDVPYLPSEEIDNTKLKSLLRILPADAVKYMQVLIGQSLTGYQPVESVVHFLYGSGGNGKSSLLAVLQRLGGTTSTRPETEILTAGGGSGFGIMKLEGARCAVFEELPEARFLEARVLKMLVGTPLITAANKYEKAREFEMVATSFVSTNWLPSVNENGDSVWRRVRAVPFTKRFAVGADDEDETVIEADDSLDGGTIMASAPDDGLLTAALRWAVAGAQKWFKNEKRLLTVPTSIKRTTRDWKGSTDSLEGFFEDTLERDEDSFVLLSDLYDAYSAYMKGSGSGAMKLTSFVQAAQQAGQDISERNSRHTGLAHSEWNNPKEAWRDSYTPRKAGDRARFVRGVRFIDC